MDDSPELELKKLCCTCLSRDRKLFQLCRLPDGVNNLYLLLSYDSEAYREGFYKDTASLYVCWECRAIMCRIRRFQHQACAAQRQLTSITEGRVHIQPTSLSRLSMHITSNQKVISESNNLTTDNFIDCGPTTDIKSESEEDIPLSELHNNWHIDTESMENKEELSKAHTDTLYKSKKKKKKDVKKSSFSTIIMDDGEFEELRKSMTVLKSFIDMKYKCDNCILGFVNEEEFEAHNSSFHVEKPDHLQCDVCLVYISVTSFQDHRDEHYHKHVCQLCVFSAYNMNDMMDHLKSMHDVKNVSPGRKKKTRHPVRPRRNPITLDKKTPYGYLCVECNKYFDNKNQRWKHVQRHHREGYKCSTCDKKFAFKNNLARHEQLHRGPLPREECPVCHKMVRTDLMKVHARIHASRARHWCAVCGKCFVSRASYHHHLKYSRPHATHDLLKYKCTMCDKGYRSRGELRDHVNYQHMGKTQHKCPVCGKALATRRCITRHVRRAHDGVKENARDKICQQCGRAFRDKKSLREHELIHTGERPLSCEICGCTFRQSASLYTHRKRIHNICYQVKKVTLVEQET